MYCRIAVITVAPLTTIGRFIGPSKRRWSTSAVSVIANESARFLTIESEKESTRPIRMPPSAPRIATTTVVNDQPCRIASGDGGAQQVVIQVVLQHLALFGSSWVRCGHGAVEGRQVRSSAGTGPLLGPGPGPSPVLSPVHGPGPGPRSRSPVSVPAQWHVFLFFVRTSSSSMLS